MTKQKMAVLDALRELDKTHPTAESIYLAAKKKHPSIAMGTVYRNLTVMAEDGEIMRISVQGEPDRFDLSAPDHFHIICEKCGTLYDIPLSMAKIEIEGLDKGTILCPETLTMNCICANCK